jgi:hypothetical protein
VSSKTYTIYTIQLLILATLSTETESDRQTGRQTIYSELTFFEKIVCKDMNIVEKIALSIPPKLKDNSVTVARTTPQTIGNKVK